ncbi:putative 2-methylcitrate dehydratase [Sporobolomyces salmoneus]|uniref:putative 2-methylcitrate dehydratase n=1 Tax=Sporobolomyces salmoneus TaxID=183962 RepID=UPI003172EF70
MLSLRSTAQRTFTSVSSRRSISIASNSLRKTSPSSSSSTSPLSRPSLPSSASSPLLSKMGQVRNSHGMGESTVRPESDKVIQDIADYVHNYKIDSDVAYSTARLCLIDTIGCGLEGLRVSPECKALMEPIVPGTVVPNGTKVPGTPFQMDPVRGAFAIGTQIRWLDFNDGNSESHGFGECSGFLAAEWGHPSDNLGAILAVADYLSRTGEPLKMKDVLEAMIKAHEIQGCMALENSFNRVGLDHVVLVKLASAAVVSKMLGLTRDQTVDVVSQVFVDGQSLRTFRHAPNTGSRKSWSAGDACMRAVHLALQVKRGQMGIPTVLTAKTWGFYDVLFKGNEFKFQRPYGSYIMENVLFKISFPAEFHAQTAAEAAHIIHKQLKDAGKSSDDIKHVKIRTQEAAIRIIDKSGPLHNFADRDHTIQYMVAVPLIFGRLTTEDYSDKVAADPRIDELRAKIQCVEDKQFTVDYHDPEKRYISNALTVTLNDGTVMDEVLVPVPVGHRERREEGTPLLNQKFIRHLTQFFSKEKADEIMKLVGDQSTLEQMGVAEFTDLFVTSE